MILAKRPSHRPLFHWPTTVLRAIVAMHPIMPWRALRAHLELLFRSHEEDHLIAPRVERIGL
jgi:hypothetical protein